MRGESTAMTASRNRERPDQETPQREDPDSALTNMRGEKLVQDGMMGDDEPIEEVSLEELEELEEAARRDLESDEIYDTQHTDGSTTNPEQAEEQGLVYIPPDDPPVLPSDDLQGVEIAAGFSDSLDGEDPRAGRLPTRLLGNDEDLEELVMAALAKNSETSTMTAVRVAAQDGVIHLYGVVDTDEEIAIVDQLVRDLAGVDDVVNHLDTEG